MQKLLLLSVVLALVYVPFRTSRDRNPMRALKQTLLLAAAFNLFYLLAIRFAYQYLQ